MLFLVEVRSQTINWHVGQESTLVLRQTDYSTRHFLGWLCDPSLIYKIWFWIKEIPLQWRRNERDGVSNHQRIDCLLNRLFKRRSKDQIKHQSYASLAFFSGIHRWPVISPHKGPVTWKRFPFDDVIMPKDWIYFVPAIDRLPLWVHGYKYKMVIRQIKTSCIIRIELNDHLG